MKKRSRKKILLSIVSFNEKISLQISNIYFNKSKNLVSVIQNLNAMFYRKLPSSMFKKMY